MAGLWELTSPTLMQAARFQVVRRACDRVGVGIDHVEIAEARVVLDQVVGEADLAAKPLAAANAAVVLPGDPLVALWQQVTVLREWRGDAHISVLVANEVGPCACMILQVGTGRFPLGAARATRGWTDDEWGATVSDLAARGWVDAGGVVTPSGREHRERIEEATDRLCAPLWAGVGASATARLQSLLAPIHQAMNAAGTYAAIS